MQTLAHRLQHVLDARGMTRADLARAAGVTEAAVTHWMNGQTHSLKGATAARLESRTGFRAGWLVAGTGQKLVAPSEQGDMLLPEEVDLINALRLLTDSERAAHIKAIKDAADHNREVLEQHLRKQHPPPAAKKPKP